jgi:TonB family protein
MESEEGEVVLEAPPEGPSPDPAQEPREGEEVDALDIRDVVGRSQAPIPSQPRTRSAVVPPRPIEITWPETDDLGHCLDLYVDIRIRVDATGEVLRVEPVAADLPPDCTRAALEAARRIKFRPGTADGKPQTMWTDIRIEFRRQRR